MTKKTLLVLGILTYILVGHVLIAIDSMQDMDQASSELIEREDDKALVNDDVNENSLITQITPSSNRRLARIKSKHRCNKYPKICESKGSPRRHCCKKKCVNLMTNRLNCGMCGHKCRKNERCCGGRCVNLLNDERNCGRCKKKCKSGDICVHGLCNYA